MENITNLFSLKGVAALSLSAVVSFLFGEIDILIKILVAFVVIDYITGIIANWGELKSSVGFNGIKRKVMIFALVAVGHMTDIAIGMEGHIFRNAVVFFYLANEVLSITENAGKVGLPIPEKVQSAISLLRKKGEGQ